MVIVLFKMSFLETCPGLAAIPRLRALEYSMQRKVFWATFVVLGLTADFTLPILWSLLATIPIGIFSWWVAYRSDWF